MEEKLNTSTPKWIAWESTLKCNLNCIHCRSSSTAETVSAVSTQKAKALMDRVAAFCSPVFVLSGGEPMMRDDVAELTEYGTALGFRMCLATNGTLVTDRAAKSLKAAGIKMVSMSLDGSRPEIHDDFRKVPGAFEKVLKAAETLKKNGMEFIINSSFTQRNMADIPNVFELAKRIGAKAWYMFMIVPAGRGEKAFEELVPPEYYEKILKWHYEAEKDEDEILMRPTCAPHYYRVMFEESRKRKEKFERRTLSFSTGGAKGCLAAQTIAFIDHKGDVRPCSYLELSGGNLFEKSFQEIWNSPLFRDLRDFKKYKGRCGQCEYIKICGGCRARAYAKTGDYLDEEPYCLHVPLKMRVKGTS